MATLLTLVLIGVALIALGVMVLCLWLNWLERDRGRSDGWMRRRS